MSLGDLDEDGVLDIVAASRDYPEGYVQVLHGDGSAVPGWPRQLDTHPGSAAAIGDITGDGSVELVVESVDSIFAFDRIGNVLWSFTLPGTFSFSYSSPVLVDLDGDGVREVVFGCHEQGSPHAGRVYVVSGPDGSDLPGWPQDTLDWVFAPVAIGDLDQDGGLDLVVGDLGEGHVYAWRVDGTLLPGFPIAGVDSVYDQVTLADLDGDGSVELMFDGNVARNGFGRYYGYNHDGTVMDGWPLTPWGMSISNMACAADFDGDGMLDVMGSTQSDATGVFITRVYSWQANVPFTPHLSYSTMRQYNPRHDGVFRMPDVTSVPEGSVTSHPLRVVPNPFEERVSVSWSNQMSSGDAGSLFDVRFYDSGGRQVRSLTSLGTSQVTWDGSDDSGRALPSGVYLCRARSGEAETSSTIVLRR